MVDHHIKELEEKIARYEAIMSRCPQCKTTLSSLEEEVQTESSRNTRSSRLVQQSAAKAPPPTFTGIPNRPAPASKLTSSTRSSKQLQSASPTEVTATNLQQRTPLVPPERRPSQTHQDTEAPNSTSQHPSTNVSNNPTTVPVTSSAAESSRRLNPSSRSPPSRASSLALRTAEGRHVHSGKLVQLDLEQHRRNRGGRPRGESPKVAAWKRGADIMLEEVPAGRSWREDVMRIDSSILAAVTMSVDPVSKGDVSLAGDVKRKELMRLVRRFAERHSEGRLNFQQFILVCLCKVLLSQDVPQAKIMETMQICITDTSKRNIERYLKGVIWANQMMNDLFPTNWGYRAVDLIAIWNRSVATYGMMAAAPDSHQYFLTDLTQRKYFEGYQEVPDRRHDTIPWIVKKELGDEVSYRDVCEALGYSQEYFTTTEHLHSSKPSSPDLDAGDSGHASSTPRSDTFHTARQSTASASSPQRPLSVNERPSNHPFSASYLEELSLRRKEHHQDDSLDDAASEDPPTSQSIASQRTKRLVPDRFAKPLGDPDVGRRRRRPSDTPSFGEFPSDSLGESAKRPLPDSPTSAFQPTTSSRRRTHVEERSSRKETGPPSRPEKKSLKDQKGRA